MEKISNTIEKVMRSKGIVYDDERANKELLRREAELQKIIDEASIAYYKRKGGLKYSGMPLKYRDMKLSDLINTKENGQMIKSMAYYIKNFKQMTKGVGIVGEMGVGKTTLIAVTCKEIVERYEKTLYFASEATILNEIKNAIDDTSFDTPEDIIRRIAGNDLVVIDEFGSTTNQWEILQIKNVIDAVLNNNNKLFITSNYNTEELLNRWKDGNTNKTPRQIRDRMEEAMNMYALSGESFRRKDK
ncbi:ATP-binding protein [Anaerococcus cruorum]|uniref:ATP-binding protein n=1 Tax=Anaerococcus cruorum TaxID=3115617 RepID=A0ABW9MWE4_9FIRM